MAESSLGDLKWRMIRRVLRVRRFRYEDCRNMTRTDRANFAWLVAGEFFRELGDGWYAVTDRGRASAELGLYEYTRPAPPLPPPA